MRKMINVINHEEEKDAVHDLDLKEVSVKDREVAHFWGRRARDSSLWSLILNTA